MPTDDSNFETLEQQLAKDALEKTLKDLHGEITREISKIKMIFLQKSVKLLLAAGKASSKKSCKKSTRK